MRTEMRSIAMPWSQQKVKSSRSTNQCSHFTLITLTECSQWR